MAFDVDVSGYLAIQQEMTKVADYCRAVYEYGDVK